MFFYSSTYFNDNVYFGVFHIVQNGLTSTPMPLKPYIPSSVTIIVMITSWHLLSEVQVLLFLTGWKISTR